MVRKTAYAGLSYMAGLFFASFFEARVALYFAFAGILLLVSYIFCFKNKRKEIFVCAISLFVGIGIYCGYSLLFYKKAVDFDGQAVVFSGEIKDIEYLSNDKCVYTVKGKINGEKAVTMRIYHDALICNYGDKVQIEGKAKTLSDSLAFPTQSYYKSKGIYLEIDNITQFEIASDNGFSAVRAVLSYRDYIIGKIKTVLPGVEGEFISALLCGDTSGLDAATKRTLFRSGIGHIVSVSGSHLMIISAVVLLLLKKIKANKKTQFAISLTVVLLFSVFAGLSVSIIRSAIMFTILMVGTLFNRKPDTLTSLSIAGIILTVASPFAIRDPSFLLSFSGVFGMAIFAPYVLKFLKMSGKLLKYKTMLVTMICVTISTIPFAAMTFDELSIISPIANLVLVPLCSISLILAVIVTFFGGVAFLAYPLWMVAGIFVKLVILLSGFFERLPFAYLPLGYNYVLFSIFLCVLGVLVVLLFMKSKKATLLSIFMSITIILCGAFITTLSNANKLKIAFFSEDSSSAAVLYSRFGVCVIDLEGRGKIASVVDKFILSKGIKNVNLLIINDNSQAVSAAYLDTLSVEIDKIAIADEQLLILNEIQAVSLSNGDVATLGDVEIAFFGDGEYAVNFSDFSFLFAENLESSSDFSSKAYYYKKGKRTVSFGSTSYSMGENSVAFLVSSDGKSNTIRRLGNALRE